MMFTMLKKDEDSVDQIDALTERKMNALHEGRESVSGKETR
jgi:hypothetical protein